MKNLLLFTFITTFILDSVTGKEVQAKVTKKVIFDMDVEGEKLGQIEIGLFGKIAPKTVKIFTELCKKSVPNGYKGSIFHLVRPGYFIAGGEYIEKDGTSVRRVIQTNPLPPESFKLSHYSGWLSMYVENWQINSMFLILTNDVPELNDKSMVFGIVLKGMDVVRKIQSAEHNIKEKPIKNHVIADCTVEKVKAFVVKQPAVIK